jgi:peptidoglycan/xylan/chitin deacetylase (PgdA/CDA1 family)
MTANLRRLYKIIVLSLAAMLAGATSLAAAPGVAFAPAAPPPLASTSPVAMVDTPSAEAPRPLDDEAPIGEFAHALPSDGVVGENLPAGPPASGELVTPGERPPLGDEEDCPESLARAHRLLASAPTETPTPLDTDMPRQRMPRPEAQVPILMYHHIAVAGPNADAVRRDLSVSPAAFEAQMAYLTSHGYHTVSLLDLLEYLQGGQALPARPIILTFDDGYDDNYTYAYPILRRYGLQGTFFIITGLVGRPGYLTWEQAREMRRGGMSLESHTCTHPDLTRSTPGHVDEEVRDSKAALERELGGPVFFLSYPSGKYNAAVITALEANGYLGAVTTQYGTTQESSALYELCRVRIRGSDTLESFVQKVELP